MFHVNTVVSILLEVSSVNVLMDLFFMTTITVVVSYYLPNNNIITIVYHYAL